MSDLKTLKALKTDWLMSTKEKGKGWEFVNVKLLKQEAIKWIKAINNDKEEPFKFSLTTTKWMRHFFNITEEDLK